MHFDEFQRIWNYTEIQRVIVNYKTKDHNITSGSVFRFWCDSPRKKNIKNFYVKSHKIYQLYSRVIRKCFKNLIFYWQRQKIRQAFHSFEINCTPLPGTFSNDTAFEKEKKTDWRDSMPFTLQWNISFDHRCTMKY